MSGIQINQPQFTPLATDFGHAPLGRLGGRAAQVGVPGAPRAAVPSQSAGQTVKNFFSRVANALTPGCLRAESKFRFGLKDFSEKTSALLGALHGGGAGRATAAGFLAGFQALRPTAQPMTSRGGDFDQIFKARLQQNLGQLSDADLAVLMKNSNSPEMAQVKMELAASGSDTAIQDFATLQSALRSEVMARAGRIVQGKLEPKIQTALDILRADPGKTAEFADNFYKAAGPAKQAVDFLASCGVIAADMPEGREKQVKLQEFASGLVKEAIDRLPAADQQRILGALPSRELRDLAKAPSPHGQPSAREIPIDGNYLVDVPLDDAPAPAKPPVFEAILGEITARDARNTGAVSGQVRAFVDEPPNPEAAPKEYLARLVGVQSAMKTAAGHVNVFGLDPGNAADLKREMADALRETVSRVPLDQLSNAELHQLGSALKFFEVDSVDATLAAAIQARKLPAQTAFRVAAEGLRAAVVAGDVSAITRFAKELSTAELRLVEVENEFGAGIAGADPQLQFRAAQMTAILEGLDVEQLSALYRACQSPEVATLGGALAETAQACAELAPDLRVPMFVAHLGLDELGKSAGALLHRAGVDPSTVAARNRPPEGALGLLSQAGREAIRDAYGIYTPPGGGVTRVEEGVCAPGFVQEFQLRFGEPLSAAQRQEQQAHGEGMGVCQQFWADAGRAQIFITDGEGATTAAVNREGFNHLEPEAQTARLSDARDRLLAFCGGDRELMMHVSRHVNQTALAPLQIALSKESPILSADGEGRLPVPAASGQQVRFTLARDPNGDVRISINYATTLQALLDPGTGGMTTVDQDRSRDSYSYDVVVKPGGQAVLDGPIRFDVHSREA